ncbi:MAG: coiled-coil domain-containing protein [Eggerthellaceae bacterium]
MARNRKPAHALLQPIGITVTALAAACLALFASYAFADTAAYADEASRLQELVEQTAAEYDEAEARVEKTEKRIRENEREIALIEEQLPALRETAGESARALYKLNRDGSFPLELLLSGGNANDLIVTCDYLDAINSHNLAAIERLSNAQEKLRQRQEQLQVDLESAQKEQEAADAALKDAQAARRKAEEEALEQARKQAEQKAAFAEAERKARRLASGGVDSGNAQRPQAQGDGIEGLSAGVSQGDVDWSADKQAFVEEWTARIDAYLAGSPLAGQGAVFAASAWDNGVDPRWSPAISCVESTKGAYCFLPCNAWGWGSYSFGSWEEAIRGHVAYLADMYGSTVTPEAASIYCPPNASFWYNRCVEEMALI